MAVLPEYQRRGIGKELLRRAQDYALNNGAHSLRLIADERNLDFYKAQGFEIIGLDKKGYFGTDNYILKKLIQEPNEEAMLKY